MNINARRAAFAERFVSFQATWRTLRRSRNFLTIDFRPFRFGAVSNENVLDVGDSADLINVERL